MRSRKGAYEWGAHKYCTVSYNKTCTGIARLRKKNMLSIINYWKTLKYETGWLILPEFKIWKHYLKMLLEHFYVDVFYWKKWWCLHTCRLTVDLLNYPMAGHIMQGYYVARFFFVFCFCFCIKMTGNDAP